MHKVDYQLKTILCADEDDKEAEAQYGCYNFFYRDIICGPVKTYRNKWEDSTSFWFYHKVLVDPESAFSDPQCQC